MNLKRLLTLASLIALVALITLVATDSTYLLRAFRATWMRGNTDVTLYDFRVQPTAVIPAGEPQPWELHEAYNQVALSDSMERLHEDLRTIAYLVIKDGKILTEKYYGEGGQDHLSSVWSVSKTYTSLLILKAVEDGLIGSVDDPVAKYLPGFDVDQQDTLTLRHLASMSAGLFWNELAHKPFSLIAKLNFYGNLDKFVLNDMYAIGEPGQIQHYNSGGTQILGAVLDQVLGEKSISDYLSEKFWQPLGYEHDGLYVLDSRRHKNEKAYGGIVTTARDASRLGLVIQDDGRWKDQAILSPAEMELIRTLPYNNQTYAYGLWTGTYQGSRFYFQAGFRGQFVISIPDHGLVVTRFGHETQSADGDLEEIDEEVFFYIAEALRLVKESGISADTAVVATP